MTIDEIRTGLVIDHIQAGKAMQLYSHLELHKLDCCVAVIQNVKSKRMGKKDIIKIDNELELDLDALGYIDSGITINIINNGKLIEKKNIELPSKLKNVIICKNPRCITSSERDIDHIFTLVNRENREYCCEYCENIISEVK
ncbi:aspartate carbamoyltransferase regulatory subunit [Eubacteriales bacterium OttesenSCG-928-G02]|nr:aspartate carbamoyltransferase regulatory subunit [Eubacteriales bacterium OttesenSCG-928-G02]